MALSCQAAGRDPTAAAAEPLAAAAHLLARAAGGGPRPEPRLTSPQRDQTILALQRSAGNQAVVRLLRQVIQRWTEPESAQVVVDAIGIAGAADLQALLDSFNTVANAGDHVGVTLPGPRTVSIAVADASDLRSRTLDKLVERKMEDLARARAPVVGQMTGAATDSDRRTAMAALRAVEAPRLAELRTLTGGRTDRWRHPDPAVQDAVLAALQMAAVFAAEADLDSPAGAHSAAANACGMDEELDWCGFFAATNYMRSSLDRDLRAGFFHVDNVEAYFTYQYGNRVKKWIHADGVWQELRVLHTARGSVRRWTDAAAIRTPGALDIRSGDIVLIDSRGGARPDHIVMVQSWDPTTRTLFTIGGNDGGYEVDTNPAHPAPRGEREADRAKRQRAEAATGRRLRPGSAGGHVGVGVQDLSTANQPNEATITADRARGRPRVRIFGIGRPSIVDFEDHAYDHTDPQRPPVRPPTSR